MNSYDSGGAKTGQDATSVPGPTQAAEAAEAAAAAPGGSAPAPSAAGGIAALSRPYQVVAAAVLGAVGVVACLHLAMVFLHVAPSNTASKQYGEAVDDWVYPEFEQNWKLFAPNPLQQNIAVQVRVQVGTSEGQRKTSGWIDLSAQDGEMIRGNLLPSHTVQNTLRRGWDFYTASHDNANKPRGTRGALSERYIRRIVMLRLADRDLGGEVQRIQVRSQTLWVQPPPWSQEKPNTRPIYRNLAWWPITAADLPEGAAQSERENERENEGETERENEHETEALR